MKFYDYTPQCDYAQKLLGNIMPEEILELAESDPNQYYNHLALLTTMTDAIDKTTQTCTLVEWDYIIERRPSFKIWPDMLEMMQHVSLEVPCETVVPPYSAFAVRFPKGSELGKYYEAVCVGFATPADQKRFRRCINASDETVWAFNSLWIGRNWQTQIKELGTFDYFSMDLQRGMTVEECFKATHFEGDAWSRALGYEERTKIDERPENVFPNLEWMLRSLICTAMFATNSHEVVKPELPDKPKHQRHGKAGKRLAEQEREAAIRKCRTFRVGADVVLPRVKHEPAEGEPETGRQLTHSHLRSGHMKWQPCGEGRQDRKLIFVAPTVVRPDLPPGKRPEYSVR